MAKVRLDLQTIMVLAIAANVIGLLKATFEPPDAFVSVAQYDQKFAALRATFKPGERVGYVADNELHPTGPDGKEDPLVVDLPSMRRFFLVQFVLAPAILLHSDAPNKLVTNFVSSAQAKKFAEEHKYRVLKDAGNGALVLERVASGTPDISAPPAPAAPASPSSAVTGTP